MFDIIDNRIYLSRGDSCTIGIDIIDDEGEPYTPQAGEQIIFSLKKSTDQCKIIFQKIFTNDDGFVISLDESDTIDITFGYYIYDVVLAAEDGIYTIIEPTAFNLTEVVHNEING